MSARVHRQNFAGKVAKVRPSPTGGLLIDAAIARAGVLKYSDGTREWFELLPDEEVFAPESMATLRGSAVTVEHPPKMVDAETWAELSVGHPTGEPTRDGDFLVLPLAVQAARAVAKVNAGELHDTSAGYTCQLDPTPGVWRGERYDARQIALRYNHVALLPEGAGRAGTDVSLRLNGGAYQVRTNARKENAVMADDPTKAGGQTGAQTPPPKTNESDGSELAAVKAQLEAVTKALTAATARIAELEAKERTEPTENGKSNEAVTEDKVPEDVKNAIAEKRIALWQSASPVLGPGVRLNGLSERAIKEAVAKRVLGENAGVEKLSASVLDGVFLTATARTNGAQGLASLGAVLSPDTTRTNANDRAESPFERSQREAQEAFQKNRAPGAQKGA